MIAKMSANVGGQAVLEGVMMRTPSSWSVAVRRPDGGVSCVSNPVTSPASRRRWLRLPVIAGLAYELIRFGARHPDNPIVRKLLAPGLWLQSLTTREPTLDQVEVSINALRDVLAAEERSQAERGVSHTANVSAKSSSGCFCAYHPSMCRT